MIQFTCTRCAGPMESPGSMAGQTETCPACGQTNRVPTAGWIAAVIPYRWRIPAVAGLLLLVVGGIALTIGIMDRHKSRPQMTDAGRRTLVGFRSLIWGCSPPKDGFFRTLREVGDGEAVDVYWKPDENLHLGEANLSSIRYAFYQGRFYQVRIDNPSGGIYEELVGLYGQPSTGGDGEFASWYFYDPNLGWGISVFYFREQDLLTITHSEIFLESEAGNKAAQEAKRRNPRHDL